MTAYCIYRASSAARANSVARCQSYLACTGDAVGRTAWADVPALLKPATPVTNTVSTPQQELCGVARHWRYMHHLTVLQQGADMYRFDTAG